MNKLRFKGHFVVEHCRDGKVLATKHIDNAVVDVGINAILDTYFNSATPVATWYLGLINDAVVADLVAADTIASHAGWTEDQNYAEAVRQTWTVGAAAAKVVTNAAYVVFSINASTTISGLFCVSDSAKGGTAGTLWATGLFTNGDVVATSGDTLNVTYTVTGAAA